MSKKRSKYITRINLDQVNGGGKKFERFERAAHLKKYKPKKKGANVPGVTREKEWDGEGIIIDSPWNDYLSHVAKVTNSSLFGSACLDVVKDFIRGEGFNKEDIGKLLVSPDERFGEFHDKLSGDAGYARRFAILVEWVPDKNFRDPKILKIHQLPVEWLRYAIPNDYGEVEKVRYNPYWNTAEEWSNKQKREYPLFTLDPAKLASQFEYFEQQKSENNEWYMYRNFGSIYFYNQTNELDRVYSRPKYFAGGENALKADNSLWLFHNRNLDNNFFLGGILSIPGNPNQEIKIDEDDDGNAVMRTRGELLQEDLANEFGGATNAGGMFVIWYDSEEGRVDLNPYNPNSNDTKFTALMPQIAGAICTGFQVPPILAGIQVEGKLGDNQDKPHAILFLNKKTWEMRTQLEIAYNKILPRLESFSGVSFEEDLTIKPLTTYDIIPQFIFDSISQEEQRKFITDNTNLELEDGVPETEEETNENDTGLID